MPLMIEEGPIQVLDAGREDVNAQDAAAPEPGAAQPDADCSCDTCQAPARDEMWTRWA